MISPLKKCTATQNRPNNSAQSQQPHLVRHVRASGCAFRHPATAGMQHAGGVDKVRLVEGAHVISAVHTVCWVSVHVCVHVYVCICLVRVC